MKVTIERRFVVHSLFKGFQEDTAVWAHDEDEVREVVSRWEQQPEVMTIEHTNRPALSEEGELYFDEWDEIQKHGPLHDTRITIQYDQAEIGSPTPAHTGLYLPDLQLWAESFYK